jgi:FAD/FMN-containing dehydrogenase
MIVTVSGDVTLDALQKHIAGNGQWLPIDPPSPEMVTIEKLLAENLSGPRRYGFGTIRDYAVGIAAVLADGRVIHSGGKVVKNVAGYDLQKLFIGGQGTLGKIVEATFKLRPVPEGERFFQKECSSLVEAGRLIEEVLDWDLVVLDLRAPFVVILGTVGENLGKFEKIRTFSSCKLDYDPEFRCQPGIQKVSVLPSKLIETLEKLGNRPFVARAGNGIIYYEGLPIQMDKPVLPRHWLQRVKDAYDPSHRLPSLST